MRTQAFEDAATMRRVRYSLALAVQAPSIHNSQPWLFAASPRAIEVHGDPARQLRVLDPTGRQLLISCGCALFNLRVALTAVGLPATVIRRPDRHQPDLVARVRWAERQGEPDAAGVALAELEPEIPRRHSNRRRFTGEPVPDSVIDTLVAAAAREGALLTHVRTAAQCAAVATLTRRADTMQLADPAYRAELRAWTTADPDRLDGVPAPAVPHVDAGSGDAVPIRDFDTHGRGGLPTETRSGRDGCLLVLSAPSDTPTEWVRAGEALERVLLEVTHAGYVAGLFSQAIEVPRTRAELRRAMGLIEHPVMVLRVGRAAPTPGTPRRNVRDVLTEREG
jgi:hypothetical protein